MQHFPIFVDLRAQRVALSGGGDAAEAKLRLLLKTEARIEVYATDPSDAIRGWAEDGKLILIRRDAEAVDLTGARLAYGAEEDAARDARFAALAEAAGALVNIVDNLGDSQFITPAIVDRDPVTVAIGTEGAAPVLARAIKRDLEERLPQRLGLLARIGKAFRPLAEKLPMGRARRDFWADYYFKTGPRAEDPKAALDALLDEHLAGTERFGHVSFVGAGPGDPELLTMKARSALDRAEVILYDRLVAPEILELARREAILIPVGKEGFGPAMPQAEINALIVQHGATAEVVRLKSGDPTVFGRLDEEIEAVEAAGIDWSVVPGITAASAAVASIGQSLTQRGRNSSVRFLTGHDMKGFAEQEWRALAEPGAVAAIYMGKKAARFIQGRLLMFGADPALPLTLIENASRADERVIATTLAELPRDLAGAAPSGPVLSFIGLAPRAAHAADVQTHPEELAL